MAEQKPYPKILHSITRSMYISLLKDHGYKKKGNTFSKVTSDGLVQVINFQSGRYEHFAIDIPDFHYPNALYGSFTVNLGVFIPEYHKTRFVNIPKFIKEYDCGIRIRIGTLCQGKEMWFKLNENDLETEKQIRKLLLDYGLPFLEKLNSRSNIVANVEEKSENVFMCPSLILLASIHNYAGRKEKARELLEKQYIETKIGPHKLHLIELSKKMGIPIALG